MRLVIHTQQVLGGKLGVPLRGRQALVSEQFLNGAQVGAFFQHVRAKGMTQRMRVNVGRESLGDGDPLYDSSHAPRSEPATASID